VKRKKLTEDAKKSASKIRSAVEMKLLQDLRFSKSSYNPWGRQIIRAIDGDDCLALIHVFETQGNLGAEVNAQVSDHYGGHVWTANIHNFVGDTGTCVHSVL